MYQIQPLNQKGKKYILNRKFSELKCKKRKKKYLFDQKKVKFIIAIIESKINYKKSLDKIIIKNFDLLCTHFEMKRCKQSERKKATTTKTRITFQEEEEKKIEVLFWCAFYFISLCLEKIYLRYQKQKSKIS